VPAPPDRRTPPVSGSSPSRVPTLSRSLLNGDDLSAPVSFAHSLSLSLSVSRAWFASAELLPPRVLLFSLCAVGLSYQFCLLHARRGPARAHSRTSPGSRPRRPPTHPTSFLEPRQCPALAPRLISHTLALSRTMPSPPYTAGDLRPRSRPSSSPETAPRLPELRPEVRHPSLCPISLIVRSVRPISPSPVFDRGGLPCSRGGRLI
jgi:hypothetical protein